MSNTIIQADHIYKSFGDVKAVNDLSFDVEQSICFGLLGPNGAGKTTMMKTIYGKATRDRHDDSVLSVLGYDPAQNELEIKSQTGVAPQDNNLDEELNVRQNLMIYAKLYGIPKKKAEDRIAELLGFMELTEKAKSNIRELSGGMKRRLVIARALINRPRLLILDEPTTGLDPQVRHLIWDKLRQLKNEGVTILMTTHYMEEAFQICDRIIIMDKGVKVMEGTPVELLKENIEEYVLEIIRKDTFHQIKSQLDQYKFRMDETHQIVLLYSDDIDHLRAIARKVPPGQSHLRQSNLEDLFLKATGRQLNEAQ